MEKILNAEVIFNLIGLLVICFLVFIFIPVINIFYGNKNKEIKADKIEARITKAIQIGKCVQIETRVFINDKKQNTISCFGRMGKLIDYNENSFTIQNHGQIFKYNVNNELI